MANHEIYIKKLENYKQASVTGFRLKQAMYNCVRACYLNNVTFPYQHLLERYCIPSGEDYITDEGYYLIKGEEIVEASRTKGLAEVFLTELSAAVGGKVVFSKDQEPMLLLGDMVLRASRLTPSMAFTDEYKEDFAVPYELYPRIINIVDGKALIETQKGVCEWQDAEKWVNNNKKGRI